MKKVSNFWVLYFYETICFRECFNLNFYMGEKVQKFFYGLKHLVKLGVESTNFKIAIGRTVFNVSCKTSYLSEAGCSFLSFFLCPRELRFSSQ